MVKLNSNFIPKIPPMAPLFMANTAANTGTVHLYAIAKLATRHGDFYCRETDHVVL
jgi:hypothetical protein